MRRGDVVRLAENDAVVHVVSLQYTFGTLFLMCGLTMPAEIADKVKKTREAPTCLWCMAARGFDDQAEASSTE